MAQRRVASCNGCLTPLQVSGRWWVWGFRSASAGVIGDHVVTLNNRNVAVDGQPVDGPTTGRQLLLGALLLVLVGGAVLAAVLVDRGSTSMAAGRDAELARSRGVFVVSCGFSHALGDDPIVEPGAPGLSHRHDFFGNPDVDAYTVAADLPGGDTTCDQKLDTASYWSPSLYSGDQPIEPEAIDAYYRAGPGVDPTTVKSYPPGLVLLGGDPAAEQAQDLYVVGWGCGRNSGAYPEPRTCPERQAMNLRVNFPDCWDGRNIDSVDHRDHTAYSEDGRCPQSHPVAIAQLTYVVHYPPVAVDDSLRLASGSTLSGHADFLNGWDQSKLDREVEVCIGRGAVCGLPYSTLDGL